jgi:signal peptidase I
MTEQKNISKSTLKTEIFSFAKTVVTIVVAVIFIRATIVEAFRIPSASMLPTLKIGDHLLVTKLNYGFQLPFIKKPIFEYARPERTDIVVFQRPDDPNTPEDDSKINIIKRVIGMPGDLIEVQGSRVLINNKPLEEKDYTVWWDNGGIASFGPARVPENHVFLMGDNRDHSKDSRFWTDPFLPMENIKGKAWLIYWSWDSLTRIGTLIR